MCWTWACAAPLSQAVSPVLCLALCLAAGAHRPAAAHGPPGRARGAAQRQQQRRRRRAPLRQRCAVADGPQVRCGHEQHVAGSGDQQQAAQRAGRACLGRGGGGLKHAQRQPRSSRASCPALLSRSGPVWWRQEGWQIGTDWGGICIGALRRAGEGQGGLGLAVNVRCGCTRKSGALSCVKQYGRSP